MPEAPENCEIHKNWEILFFGSQNLRIFDHRDGSIESDATVEKKSNFPVLKFPHPVDIFEPKSFWKWAGNLFWVSPWENNGNIKNT